MTLPRRVTYVPQRNNGRHVQSLVKMSVGGETGISAKIKSADSSSHNKCYVKHI